MESNETENINSQNDEQETTDSVNGEQEQTNDVPEYTEREKQYYARIKKLEAELAGVKKEEAPKTKPKTAEQNSAFSLKDATALMAASVTEDEDIEEVENYAKYRKMTIAEALKDSTLKTILANRQEERKTAQATSTRNARPSVKKASGDELAQNLRKGNVPEVGTSDAEELFWARRGGRRS